MAGGGLRVAYGWPAVAAAGCGRAADGPAAASGRNNAPRRGSRARLPRDLAAPEPACACLACLARPAWLGLPA